MLSRTSYSEMSTSHRTNVCVTYIVSQSDRPTVHEDAVHWEEHVSVRLLSDLPDALSRIEPEQFIISVYDLYRNASTNDAYSELMYTVCTCIVSTQTATVSHRSVLTPTGHQVEKDIQVGVWECDIGDEACDCCACCQETRVDGGYDQPVEHGIGGRESRTVSVQQDDKHGCDGCICYSTDNVDGPGDVFDCQQVSEDAEADGLAEIH